MRNLTVEQQYSPSLDATSEMTGFTTDINAPYTFSSSLPTQVFKVYAKNNATTNYSRIIGEKSYELNDHLGNFNDTWVLSSKTLSGINPVRNLSEATGIRVVISDRKYLADRDDDNNISTGDNFVPEVLSANEYGAFGNLLNGRGFSKRDYRYGFQGQEKNDEVKGEGNSVNYKYRMHAPRVGRFFAVDPLFRKFPYWSPYAFSGNQVIHTVELEGLENENNLNENEQEQEVQIHQMTEIFVRKGKEGDWIAGGEGIPGILVIYSPDIQARNFAELVGGEVKRERNEGGGATPVVVICSNSFVAHDVFALLEEQHGIKEDQLSKAEKRELLTVRFDKDRSDLFNYRIDDVMLANPGAIAIPLLATRAIPIVLYPGDMISAGDVYLPAGRLAQGLVDEFAKSSKRVAREQGKAARDSQPASEDYAKWKAKSTEKKFGKDARREAHDKKPKGAPDRTKKQLNEDYE
jgi:RHS repeat-associated protein